MKNIQITIKTCRWFKRPAAYIVMGLLTANSINSVWAMDITDTSVTATTVNTAAGSAGINLTSTDPAGINLNSTNGVSITGTATLNNDLTVTGNTTLNGINVDNNFTVADTTGNVDINYNLNVDGNTDLDNVNVVGNTSIVGTTSINTSGFATTTLGTNGNLTRLNSSTIDIGTLAYTTTVTLGNTQTASQVTARGGNSTITVANNEASLLSGVGVNANGLRAFSAAQTIGIPGSGANYELKNGNASSQALVAGQTASNILIGDTLVDGNMHINGTLTYSSSVSANTTVTSGASSLPGATLTTIGSVQVANTNGINVDENGKLSLSGATVPTAGVVLTNGYGNTHGFVVTEQQVTLSGGINSTSLTLNDAGATLSNASTGRPVQLHGIADGTTPFDAVNFRQLREVKRGLAATTAMTNIPPIDANKRFSVGVGIGGYDEETALAVGSSVRFNKDFVIRASLGHAFRGESSSSNTSWGVGSSYSW